MTGSGPADGGGFEASVVSVIIPAWRLTTELGFCLDALAAQVDSPPFEVIVVVNGGDPEVIRVASEHRLQPIVVPLPANVGFGRACNLGSTRARGEFLVFLNDDTIVEPAWLAALVTAGRRVGVGAVASLLLAMDGVTVAEAGARINQDGYSMPFGAGLTLTAAERSGLLDPRPIDFGSAAALLVRTDLFRELGGFDPMYAPAYYEDVDLQFRIREAGYSVWYEPTARVRHFTNQSTKELDQSYLFFAVDNSRTAFKARWAEALKTAPVFIIENGKVTSADRLDSMITIPLAERSKTNSSESLMDGSFTDKQIATMALDTERKYANWVLQLLYYVQHPEKADQQARNYLYALRERT